MKTRTPLVRLPFLLFLLVLAATASRAEEPVPAATAAYNNYLVRLEGRLAQQHRAAATFIAGLDSPARLAGPHQGQPVLEQLNSDQLNSPADADLPGALLHHWRGTAFIPGAHAADFEHLLRDFPAYPRVYAPQVVSARTLSTKGDRMQALMRVRQKHVLTVVLDTTYDVTFARLDPARGFSISHGTHVSEIADAGAAKERALSATEQHGFLWRIDTYWSWAEQDGGLYIQIESATLTRGIPRGLGWAIAPFIQSIPRESLEFTLRSTAAALARRN
jgi:hypothetical protein